MDQWIDEILEYLWSRKVGLESFIARTACHSNICSMDILHSSHGSEQQQFM